VPQEEDIESGKDVQRSTYEPDNKLGTDNSHYSPYKSPILTSLTDSLIFPMAPIHFLYRVQRGRVVKMLILSSMKGIPTQN